MDSTLAIVAKAKWVLDSGATHHMTSDRTQFQAIKHDQREISVANGGTMTADRQGDVLSNLVVDGLRTK